METPAGLREALVPMAPKICEAWCVRRAPPGTGSDASGPDRAQDDVDAARKTRQRGGGHCTRAARGRGAHLGARSDGGAARVSRSVLARSPLAPHDQDASRA